jgi:hypothetical protein
METLIVPIDAHCYKITEMLKQFKIIILAPTCFGSRRNHHQGAVLCLAKTTKYSFSVLPTSTEKPFYIYIIFIYYLYYIYNMSEEVL